MLSKLKKLKKNKKGIELSINFIVMLILALAMFTGGLIFISKFFSKTTAIRGSLDSQTEQQIEKLLDSGSKVVIPIHTKDIYREQSATFGIGVLADEDAKYIMKPEFNTAFDVNKKTIFGSAQNWLVLASGDYNQYSKDLKKNQKEKFLILVNVPDTAVKGTYVFKVQIYKGIVADANKYDFPLEMIVRVP